MGNKQNQPEQQAPPVQKLRVRYAKRGRARFTSHRDFGRAFERALRRAEIPMAYSSGFNPHPRVSYANASPTGAATEAEYLEIGLWEICDAAKVRDALDAALPPGLDIVSVVESSPGSLADGLVASSWRATWADADPATIGKAIETFLAADRIEVERLTKNGMRAFDAREPVAALNPVVGGLEMVIRHTVPLVRPDDVLQGLHKVEPAFQPPAGVLITRLSQGELQDDQVNNLF